MMASSTLDFAASSISVPVASSSTSPSRPRPSSTSASQPTSPSFSTSGSELSYASDTESNATDYITTPPTSPQRAQQIFQQQMSTMLSSPTSVSSPTSHRHHHQSAFTEAEDILKEPISSVSIGSMLESMKLPGSQEITPSSSSIGSSVSTPTPAMTHTSPSSTHLTGTKARPPLQQSLSAKRARQTPGTLDLSSLPQFPLHPPLHLTPRGSEVSGSTPRALPERPGLFSRWSTDSESVSSCTSSDCDFTDEEGEVRMAEHEGQEGHDSADEADGEHGEGNESSGAKRPSNRRSITMKRSTSGPYNPFFLSANPYSNAILSPLPVSSPSAVSSLLPPAPKPHQSGFSPYAEEPDFGFASMSSSSTTGASTPLLQLSPSSPSAMQIPFPRKKRSHHHHKHRHAKGSRSPDATSSNSSRCSTPGGEAAPPRLTRSQGLRIKDSGDRPRGRYARALSQQLKHSMDAPSSPMKTAAALLDGTISPAETTTDPLRVRLRDMPGVKTPDVGSAPPSPLISSSKPTSLPYQQQQHLQVHRASLASPRLRASSPLHLSSFPGENGKKDTKKDVFNSAFSFANRESPIRSPLALRSPRSPMGTIRETEADSNPYFAGFV